MSLNLKWLFFLIFFLQFLQACTLYRSDGRKKFETGTFNSLSLLACQSHPKTNFENISLEIDHILSQQNLSIQDVETEISIENEQTFQFCIYEKATSEDNL